MHWRRLALIGLIVACPVAARPDPAVFPAHVEVVNIVATVQDQRCLAVGNLRAGDFVVREDGRPQALQVFARAADPSSDAALSIDANLLLDVSDSMTESASLSQRAAAAFLDMVPRARLHFVVLFDHDVRAARYQPHDPDGLLRWIRSTPLGGGTALYDAVDVAMAHVRSGAGRSVMVLVSDGEDRGSRLSFEQFERVVRSGRTLIYPIALSGTPRKAGRQETKGDAVLRRLATLTGGDVFRPRDAQDVPAIYRRILSELASQYLLGYVSDNPRRDGAYRKLSVEVRQRGLGVRHQAGYYAPLG